MVAVSLKKNFFKQKTAYEITTRLVGSEMCIRDSFYCGNDADAKVEVAALLKDFGWTDTLDLGDISMSRYTEMLGAFWPAALNVTGNMDWGFKLVRKH